MFTKPGTQNPHCISPFLLRGWQSGGRASCSLRLIRLWRNRQLARNDTQIVQRIWKHHTGLSFPFSPPKKFSRRRQSQHTERYNRRRLVRFETAQLRKDLGAEQPDRTHQVFLSDVADIELAEYRVEQPLSSRRFYFRRHSLGRSDEGEIALQ